MQEIKFNGNQSDFYIDLRKRVNEYFKDTNREKTGDYRIILKAVFFSISFIASYILLVFVDMPVWLSIPLCVYAGIITAGIGFNMMHDGSHGSFSQNKTLNKMAELSLNFLGCSSFFWNVKHVVVHHTYTNIDGMDDDIGNEPMLRLCETQKRYAFHGLQQYYFVFIYGLLYLGWIFLLDFIKYFSRKVGNKENIHINTSTHVGFWSTKVIYSILFVALPIWQLGFVKFIIGYSVYMFVTGITISLVFQLAHCVENMAFDHPMKDGKIANDWATHQVATTSNFATQSKLVSFFTGGLNFQIEHHLFPKISHIHYPEISKIVKNVCAKHGISYFEQKTLLNAIVSHVKHLKEMGRK